MVGVLAGVVAFLSFVPYIRHILTGTVRPERASWLIWAVLTSIAFFSNLAAGARAALWLPALASLGVLVVFALSIRFGMGGLAGRDTVALTMAAAGPAAEPGLVRTGRVAAPNPVPVRSS